MTIDIDTIITVTLWVVLASTLSGLVCIGLSWRDITRRTDANLGREDIARLSERRKETTR